MSGPSVPDFLPLPLHPCGCQAAATVDLLPLATTAPEPKGAPPRPTPFRLSAAPSREEVPS
eukprot:519342-Alexandrium_andersonii.AAC.1